MLHVRWLKPLKKDFDVEKFPGRYRIELSRRAQDQATFTLLKTYLLNEQELFATSDTNYLDSGLNTAHKQYEYSIQLFYNNGETGYTPSPTATSLRLELQPSDMQIKLSWKATVPWSNYSFDVYRKELNSNYSKILTTREEFYTDRDLEDGKDYCYYIEAAGSYNVSTIAAPLINKSEEACSKPIDNIAPCSSKLQASNFCSDPTLYDEEDLFNDLKWSDPNFSCETGIETIASYKIYYGKSEDELTELTKVSSVSRTFRHFLNEQNISGCYAVTALDEKGNESKLSNIVCLENCPLYELPNTFTPNNDGSNDVFRPRKNLFVSTIELKIFNEWGNLVFSTTDPEINWRGVSNSGKELTSGTYYYTCIVNEIFSNGEEKRLKGFIHLLK
jgi:gliding motility-associated-like protein